MDDTLKDLGIKIEKSVPYVHQQNGCAECAIRTIVEKAQALQLTACLPQSFQEFCIEHSAHINNLTPIAQHKWKTPHEVLKSEKPNVGTLWVFGCGTYIYILEDKQNNKLAPRLELMTYISVESGVKGHHFMHKSGTIFLGAMATFDETLFPYCRSAKTPTLTELSELPPSMEEHNHSYEDDDDRDDDRYVPQHI